MTLVCTHGSSADSSAATKDAVRCRSKQFNAGAGDRPLAQAPAVAPLSCRDITLCR